MLPPSNHLRQFATTVLNLHAEKFREEFPAFLQSGKYADKYLPQAEDCVKISEFLLKYFSGEDKEPSPRSIYPFWYFRCETVLKAMEYIHAVRTFHLAFKAFFRESSFVKTKEQQKALEELEIKLHEIETAFITEILDSVRPENEKHLELHSALKLGGVGSYYWELDTGHYEVSDQTEKILNVRKGATLDYFLSKVHPDDLTRVMEAIKIEGTGDKNFDVEFRIKVKDVEKHLWCRGKIIARNGKPQLIQGSLIDVTERNRLVQNLQRSKQLFKEAQELALLGNWAWNRETDELEASEVFYKIFNIPVPENRIMHFWDTLQYIHPDDKPIVLDRIKNNPHGTIDIVYRIKLADGSIKYIHSRGKPSTAGSTWRYGTIQDITRQKITEHHLFNEKKFNLKLAEASPAIIISYALGKNEVQFVNKAVKVILGYDPEEIREGGFDFFKQNIHPDDYEVMIGKIRHQIYHIFHPSNPDVIHDFQVRLKNKEGHYRWMTCYWVVFAHDEEGRPKELLAVAVDNTEQIEAERKIRQKTLELQQSNASLEEFARVASHDLKEPLRKISTFADRLEAYSDALPDNGKVYLEKIRDSAIRMQQLIDNLLSVSVITSDKSFEMHPLQPLIWESLGDLELKIEETHAAIHVDVPYKALVNPGQFRQLMQNLVSNSLKFSKNGIPPKVSITAKTLKGEELKGKEINKEDDYLEIKVSDNGIGFEPQFSRQIFNIFQRLNDRHEYSGTGIGLAICKKIVENHGGYIEAVSSPGIGSDFIVVLPLSLNKS